MKNSTFRRSHISRWAGGALITGALLTAGCLQRPVKQQTPNTSNVFVEQIQNTSINEIDMLFVIDNSVSMGDKQEILSVAVPKMVERLVAPNCVSPDGTVIGQSTLQGAGQPPSCESGGSLEFVPVSDIHLGVISSSLGGHGSDRCTSQGEADMDGLVWYEDDKGRLVPSQRPAGLNMGPEGLGFLSWQGGTEAEADQLNVDFTDHVTATGELGCGFEAPLEAWYRFLVDPLPPAAITVNGSQSDIVRDDAGLPIIDDQIIAQRAAFLRPEGLVAIVVLTDENDCSIMDGGDYYNNAKFGYLLASTEVNGGDFFMPVATPTCDTNPNAECCLSCLQRVSPPANCSAEVAATCNGVGSGLPEAAPVLSEEADPPNVRCFNNKKRFGVDLLYPVKRYVDALTRTEIVNARTGDLVDNPLLRSQGKVRPPGRVFFAGIVGVPWQDIATDDSLDPNTDTMRYRTAADLSLPWDGAAGSPTRWEIILGSPNLAQGSKTCEEQDNPACGVAPVPPLDPFMLEQIEPRPTGATHPIVGDQAIVDASSTNPQANIINGHEYNTSVEERGQINDDLQYACIFPLSTPKDAATCADSVSCDCGLEASRNRPLCQPPGGGAAEPAQYWGKAYPGTRILQVLRDFGANSIVGSICPKVTDDPNKADYGYNPAVQAIVDRLAEKLVGACLPRELTIDENGEVPCFVVEARPPDVNAGTLNCGGDGRGEVDPTVRASVLSQLAQTGYCTDANNQGGADIPCDSYEMCEILPLKDNGRSQCLYNQAPADSLMNAGYCYIDPAKQSDDDAYIAGGDAAEAAAAGHPETVPTNGENAIVQDCKATERRLLRFVGADTPAENAITLVACTGDAAGADNPIPVAPAATMTTADDTGM